MIYFSVLIDPVHIHPGVKEHLYKGNHLGEYQPNINHLDIGGRWKTLRDTDEEGSKHEKRSEVDSNNSFKKEVLEEVCRINNNEDENCWEIDSEDSIVNPSLQNNFYVDSIFFSV